MGEKPIDSEIMILDHQPNTKTTLTTGSQAETWPQKGKARKTPLPEAAGASVENAASYWSSLETTGKLTWHRLSSSLRLEGSLWKPFHSRQEEMEML